MNFTEAEQPYNAKVAERVGTPAAREEVHCALLDNDVWNITTGEISAFNALRLVRWLELRSGDEGDPVFVATALVMLAENWRDSQTDDIDMGEGE